MSTTQYRAAFALAFLAACAVAWLTTGLTSSASAADAAPIDASVLRRQAIAFYERRLTEDPHSALDMAQLAALFMEQGRLAGDERAFVRAESLALRSIGERTKKNGRSVALLVNALLAQHRFDEAVNAARQLVDREPDEAAYRALLAEALLEVGDYDAAITQLTSVTSHRNDLGIAPRFARWAELTGRIGDARRILQAAHDEAIRRTDLTGEQRAWFALRLADVELRHGNLRSAAAAIATGLQDSPGDWRLLLAKARLEMTRNRWRSAARYAEDVIAIVPTPEALAILATARRSLGQNEDADALEAVLESQVQAGMLHRSWAFVLLDGGKSVDAIIQAASADTLVRRDVHTLDLLAWSLHRAGRTTEAVPVIRRATQLASAEPSMRYHAGMIEAIAGDPAAARNHFEIALGRRRGLSHTQIEEIERALKALQRGEDN